VKAKIKPSQTNKMMCIIERELTCHQCVLNNPTIPIPNPIPENNPKIICQTWSSLRQPVKFKIMNKTASVKKIQNRIFRAFIFTLTRKINLIFENISP
jgi:hypothetical protein